MQKTRKVIASLLALALALTLLAAPPARAESETAAPVLAVASVTGEKGSEVAVAVTLRGGPVSGGNLELRYDTSALTLKSTAAGSLAGTLVSINEKYRADTVSVSVAGTGVLPEECVLLTLTFTVSANAAPGTYPVSLCNVRLYDRNVQAVTAQVEDGGVTVPCVQLRVEMVEASAMQSVKVQLLLDEGLYPTGGDLIVTYDPAVLTAGAVARGSALPNSSLLLGNADRGTGRIAITWAGTEAAQRGVLCTLSFAVSADAAGTLPIAVVEARLRDETGGLMDLAVTNGGVTIVAPSTESPKLWVVGGLVEDDGTATVGVVLQGRGSICGGEFTLHYDPAKCELLACGAPDALDAAVVVNSPLADSENRTAPGTVKLAWAGAAPSVRSQQLLRLRFRVIGQGSELELSGAKTLDAAGNAVAQVDLRSGAIRTGDTVLQLPVMSVDARRTSGGTQVSATVDVANAMQFTDQAQQRVRVFVGLYENGRLRTVEVDPQSITFDENGIASVQVETVCQGSATLLKVFFLGESTGTPCAEASSETLTVS